MRIQPKSIAMAWRYCGCIPWTRNSVAQPTQSLSARIGALSVISLLACSTLTFAAEHHIDLAGQWQVRLDSDGQFDPSDHPHSGESDFAFQPTQLPGALRDSGLGIPVGPNTQWIGGVRPEVWDRPQYKKYQDPKQFKIPFWLQPERRFLGAAYYRRDVEIPDSWRGRRVLLTLERPHWQTQVWVNATRVGSNDSLSTPHVFDLTGQLTPGQHTLTIRVDNSLDPLDVGLNSHSVSDHTQSAWHGIVGKIELHSLPQVAIQDVEVFPAEDARSVKVKLRFSGISGNIHDDTVTLQAFQGGEILGQHSQTITIDNDDTTIDCELSFDREARRWDEFNPDLCQLQATLRSDETAAKHVSFGVRHIKTAGTRFVLNGRPLFLRGTLECCIFPLTGYPPTDVDSWKRIIRICKAHGLNHIRFHSWCPPEAAFVAADELGFYYQVECSTWPNASTSLGNGMPIDQWLYREGERVLDAYGNHPSFVLLAMGNEPGGPQRGAKYLGPWVEHFKAETDRQLVTSASGWPSIVENEFHVTPDPRIQQWGQGVRSRINAEPPATVADYQEFVRGYDVPVISHEIGQWCVYPNFEEMEKYTGSLRPRNFEIFLDLLKQSHMLDQAGDFLIASGKLQALCYKEEIESALRTEGFGGFQLLDLHDFPGQGTALVGVLDPFWDSKPYITAKQFRRFCGPTVPLARLPKRTWTSDETFVADIEISHFGANTLRDATPRWRVTCDGNMVASGTLSTRDIPCGELSKLGRIELPLESLAAPAKITLTIAIDADEDRIANDWDCFVYPSETLAEPPPEVMVTGELNDKVAEHLSAGGKVLLLAPPPTVNSDVQIGFSSIFWNTAWTEGQAPHTLGILCDPLHRALASFPTDNHSNWQWWELLSRSKPMVLDDLSPALRPIIQVVPDWFRPQRLGLVVEAEADSGKLLLCSIDLDSELEDRPAARQMRHSLLRYMASDAFAPQHSIKLDDVRRLFHGPTTLPRIGTTLRSGSTRENHPAEFAIDNHAGRLVAPEVGDE